MSSFRLKSIFPTLLFISITGCDLEPDVQTTTAVFADTVNIESDETTAAAFPRPFSRLSGIATLPGGRLLISDATEQVVGVADFETQEFASMGGTGSGPGEFTSPGRAFWLGGDSVAVMDSRRAEVLTFDLNTWQHIRTVPLPRETTGIWLRGMDARGGYYFQGRSEQLFSTASDVDFPDSADVIRWEPGSEHVDTLATVKIREMTVSSTVRGTDRSRSVARVERPVPLASQDNWAVTNEGDLYIVRSGDFHVDVFSDGVIHRGPVIDFSPLALTADEAAAFDSLEADPPRSKPPFVPGSTYLSPSGEITVRASASTADSAASYYMLDPEGRPERVLRVPPGYRIVSMGADYLYLMHTDAQGLYWLERHPLPWRTPE